jgi:mRNA-degrading endonuclease RelE of RelBE toxin-antitoxin system
LKSKTTPEFWKCFNALPNEVQELARKNFALWLANPRYPSIRFRPHGSGKWSARIGDHYRAIAHYDGDSYVWT